MPPRLLRPGPLAVPPRRRGDAGRGAEGTEARVDQIDAALQVNPVGGFLLPDHLDETLEVFGADGEPLGEMLHEAVERRGDVGDRRRAATGPADAGPRFGLDAGAAAARPASPPALVAADAAARGRRAGRRPTPTGESALTALLRAIDTTLWTVDTFAAFGSRARRRPGRPADRGRARAAASCSCSRRTDVDLSDPARAARVGGRRTRLARYAFPVPHRRADPHRRRRPRLLRRRRLRALRIVDKAIAGSAAEAGRSRGQLGLIDASSGMPAARPDRPPLHRRHRRRRHAAAAPRPDGDADHPHAPGRPGAPHLAACCPASSSQLARDWVGPGLAAIAPSLRTGPVLVETDLDADRQVRLPKVSVFGKDQDFWWRDTPATWRNDAILAATQTALLPATPGRAARGLGAGRARRAAAADGRGRREPLRRSRAAAARAVRRRPRGPARLLAAAACRLRPGGARTRRARRRRRRAVGAGGARARRAAPSGRTDLWLPIGPARVLGGQAERPARASPGRVRAIAVHPDGRADLRGRRRTAASGTPPTAARTGSPWAGSRRHRHSPHLGWRTGTPAARSW